MIRLSIQELYFNKSKCQIKKICNIISNKETNSFSYLFSKNKPYYDIKESKEIFNSYSEIPFLPQLPSKMRSSSLHKYRGYLRSTHSSNLKELKNS